MRYGTRKKRGLYLNKTMQALYIIAYDVALSRVLPVNCKDLHYIVERRVGLEAAVFSVNIRQLWNPRLGLGMAGLLYWE